MLDLGFKISSRNDSLKRKRENIPSKPLPKTRKCPMTPRKKQKLFDLCAHDSNSKNGRRSVFTWNDQNEREKTEVRHLIKPIARILNQYSPLKKKEVCEKVCRRTIREFKIFKKPCRETCLCPHCKKRKEIVQWVNNKSQNRY
jgi:hypothetical protein